MGSVVSSLSPPPEDDDLFSTSSQPQNPPHHASSAGVAASLNKPKQPTTTRPPLTPDHTPPVPPTKRKMGRFEPPAWAKERVSKPASSPKSTQADDVDLFSRSKDTLPSIVARKEERKEHKEHKVAIKPEIRTTESKTSIKDENVQTNDRYTKRRRISSPGDGDWLNSHSSSASHSQSPTLERVPEPIAPLSSIPPSNSGQVTINLDDSDEDEMQGPPRPNPSDNPRTPSATQQRKVWETIDDDGDSWPVEQPHNAETPPLSPRAHPNSLGSTFPPRPPPYTGPDPKIQVLIDTHIPETKNLIVTIRYMQKFKEIKNAWCDINNITSPTKEEVFFSYRGKKVFPIANCRSLGITLDEDGLPIIKDSDGSVDSGDQIVFVATTPAIQEEEIRLAKEEQQRAVEEEAVRSGAETKPATSAERVFRVTMRSKDRVDLKLRIKESTPVAKLFATFRSLHKLPLDTRVRIEYDGEEFPADAVMRDTELMELESEDEVAMLHVHVK